MEFAPPAPYRRTGRNEILEGDHVGIRLSFEGEGDHKMYFTSGIAGEFGEALPLVGEPAVPEGGTGRLMGASATWILTWDEPDACGHRSVTGVGFSRSEFTDVLVAAGLIPPN